MTRCPKCSNNRIGGPLYQRNVFGTERLRYWCRTCDYEALVPCHDAQKVDDQLYCSQLIGPEEKP